MKTLVYSKTGQPVNTGDIVHVIGVPFEVVYIVAPPHALSQGYVGCRPIEAPKHKGMPRNPLATREYAPNLIKAKWHDDTGPFQHELDL